MEEKELNTQTSLNNIRIMNGLVGINKKQFGFVNFNNQEKEIDESFKDIDLKIAIIKEKALHIMKNIKSAK